MSLLYESKECYSNVVHYRAIQDTFEMSQARQAQAFVGELIRSNWLVPLQEDEAETAKQTPALVKQQADRLLRRTKIRALLRLRNVA